MTPDGQVGLVAQPNSSPGRVSVIDLAAQQPPSISPPAIAVATSPDPQSTAVTPDGHYTLIADGGGATSVSSVNLQTRTIVNTLSGMPIFQAIAITPDGTLALLVGANANQVAVLSVSAAACWRIPVSASRWRVLWAGRDRLRSHRTESWRSSRTTSATW